MSNIDAAIDKNGSIHLVWEEYTNENHVICYGLKNESNERCYLKSKISANNINSYDPKMELSSDALFVTWQSDYNGTPVISLAKSTDGGLTWDNINLADTNLSTPYYGLWETQRMIGGNQQIVNTEDDLYVFWNELTDDNRGDAFRLYFRNSSDRGLTWNPTITLGSRYIFGYSFPPIFKIKKSNDGKIHLLGIDDGGGRSVGVFYKSLIPANDTIYLNGIPSRSCSSLPDFIVEEDGSIHVAWAQGENKTNYIKYLKFVNGSKTIKNLTETKCLFLNIALEMDANGTLFITWVDHNNKNYDIFYKYSDDGGASWSSDIKIVENQCLMPNYKLVVSDAKSAIVWIDSNNGTINHKVLSE